MIKLLTFLCLSISSFSLNFASSISDESGELKRLRLQARDYFKEGDLENERLTRIEILALKQDSKTLRLAVQFHVVCEKFEIARYLLESFSHSLDPLNIKTLRDYFQDEKVKLENRKKNFKAEQQEEIPEFKTDDKGQIILPTNEEVKLNLLKLLAREYFRKGDCEQERLKLVEVAKLKRDFSSFKRAIEQCAVCLKFEEGNVLLDNAKGYLSRVEFQALGDYLQEKQTKYAQRHRVFVVPSKKK